MYFVQGYGAASGPANGQGPQPNGKFRLLIIKKHENCSFPRFSTASTLAHSCHVVSPREETSEWRRHWKNADAIKRYVIWDFFCCLSPPFTESVLASFSCFSKVLVRQWVHKMDLVDTRPKEWVGQEIQQGMI